VAPIRRAWVRRACSGGRLRPQPGFGPGLTTEVALVVDFLLGALAQRETAIAAGLGVATAIVLAGRDRIHRVVRDTLSKREPHDGLRFAACALIVLPLVPDKSLGRTDRSILPSSGDWL
jgi:uncharacterized membrane protein (DUF4010 family)